jgi:hypothetical protein
MSPVAGPLKVLADDIARLSAALGRSVRLDIAAVCERTGQLPLGEPGLASPNGACRLIPAADGWIAVNLARDADLDLLPAWLDAELSDDPWTLVAEAAGVRPVAALIEGARLLGLPVSAVGEARPGSLEAARIPFGQPGERRRRPRRVVDLSSLWAGPLCGLALAELGAEVVKVESLARPDPSRTSTPEFYARLNGGKGKLALDFASAADRTRLREMILAADVVITSARPRAFEQLGLPPAEIFTARPELVWTAISGHGWTGPQSDRVAFGDDAAAAGGLVRWTPDGQPRFLGDALGDPLTGLSAAVATLEALGAGGGVVVDAGMARTAAGAAEALDLGAG